jgi:stage V sporulation protein AC
VVKLGRSKSKQTKAELNAKYKRYQTDVSYKNPKPQILPHLIKAFVVGGLICVIGQILLNYFTSVEPTNGERAAATLASMIILGALATDLGIYDDLGEFSGMGAAVPITGFSNTIVSAAIDFKREGWVTGMASKMFVIAGPVLVFGILSGFFVGLIKALVTGLI